jgi:hypothetical protein
MIDPRILPVLDRYSRGEVSAYDAACDIQDLGIHGLDDPSAGDVVYWAWEAGLGPPIPSEEEARAEAERIIGFYRQRDQRGRS